MDQNILSGLQHDNSQRDDFELMIAKCHEFGGIFVFSQVHVEECKASTRPKEFVRILESLDAYFIADWADGKSEQLLEPRRARELILAREGAMDSLARRFADSIKILNFAIGGLGSGDANRLLEEMANDLNSDWNEITLDLPSVFRPIFEAKREEALQIIRNFPAEQFRNETTLWMAAFKSRLPRNFAQLDQVSAENAIEYILGLLESADQLGFNKEFPRNFAKEKCLPYGVLTGFAFMFFVLGLVRDSRTSGGAASKRHQHFLGQFRDCQHIEYASRCDVFLTKDKKATRLAKSVYSYAGRTTEVWHLANAKD